MAIKDNPVKKLNLVKTKRKELKKAKKLVEKRIDKKEQSRNQLNVPDEKMNSLNKAMSEFDVMMKQFEKTFEMLDQEEKRLNREIAELVNTSNSLFVLKNALEKAEENNDYNKIKKFKMALEDLENIENLNVLKKDKYIDKDLLKENFSKSLKRHRTRAEDIIASSEYQFLTVKRLSDNLKNALSDDYSKYSKLFLSYFYKFIIEDNLENYPLFTERLIFLLNNLRDFENEKLVKNIEEVIDKLIS